jgi:hypothetical protein
MKHCMAKLSVQPTNSPCCLSLLRIETRFDAWQALANNRRIQAQNNAPSDFPAFVRQGYDIKILADGYEVEESGLIYKVPRHFLGLGSHVHSNLRGIDKEAI